MKQEHESEYMMDNKKKECRMSNIVAAIVAILLAIVALVMNIEAATWKVPARWNDPTDSTRLTFYKNGSSAMTAKRTTPRSYDTTFTVNNDTFYTAAFAIYYAGVDSAATWVWERSILSGSSMELRDSLLNLWPDAPVNLVNNSSFERAVGGNVAGWRVQSGTVTRTTTAARSGKYGMRLAGNGSVSAIISDSIYLEGGDRVRFGGKALDAVTNFSYISLMDGADVEVAYATVSYPLIWASYQMTYKNPTNTADFYYIKIYRTGTTANDTCYVDDVYLYMEKSLEGNDTLYAMGGNVVNASAVATSGAQEIASHAKDSVWKANLDANDNVAGSFGDSAGGWGATAAGASCAGSGSKSVRIFAVDTSGTDIAVQGVNLTINNAAGGFVAALHTGSNGSATFNLDTASGANRYNFYGNKSFYIFPNDTFSVTAQIDSMAHEGYDVTNSLPSSPNVCVVYGTLWRADSTKIAGAEIIATRIVGDAVTGVFGATRVIVTGEPVAVRSDTSGYFTLNLIRSGTVSPAANAYYNIVGKMGDRQMFEIKKLAIPASGNINLADSLANRL